MFLRDLGDTEVGAFGISSIGDLFLIEDVRLVEQRCTGVTVEFNDEAVADYLDQQIDGGRTPERFARHWIHTHPGESAVPSGTDIDTFARAFGGSDWAVMMILACGGETSTRLRFGCGPGAELDVPVAVDWTTPFAGTDHEAWEQEFQYCVHPVRPPKRARSRLGQTTEFDADSFELFDERELFPPLFDDFDLERSLDDRWVPY